MHFHLPLLPPAPPHPRSPRFRASSLRIEVSPSCPSSSADGHSCGRQQGPRGLRGFCFLPCLESVFPVAVPPEVTTPPKPGRPRSLAAETWLFAGGRRPVRDSRAPGPGPRPRLAQRTSQKTGWHGAGMERARRRQTLLNVGLLLKRSWGTTGEGPRGKPQRRRRPRPARQQEGGASGERAGVPRRQQWPPRVGGGRRPSSWGHEREESQSRFCRSCRARGKHVRD